MPTKYFPIDQLFGRLKWDGDAPPYMSPKGKIFRQSYWLCLCGRRITARNDSVVSGRSNSCGCLQMEISTRHGHNSNGNPSRTYRAWRHMKDRCTNPRDAGWKNWGGRGITVCQRWMDFQNFLADMGECPPNREIDRWPDKNGDYEPDNCRWATSKEQARNTRHNRVMTIRGVTGCLADLCEHFGVKYQRVLDRLHRDWPDDLAFFAPKAFRFRQP